MQSDMLEKAQARVATAQKQLDDALLNGTETTQAREHLAGTQAEVARIEAAIASESARIEAEKHQDMDARAAELAEAAKAKLLADFERMGFDSLPEFSIPTSPAISYLRAQDLVEAAQKRQALNEAEYRKLQRRVDDLGEQIAAITRRRSGGNEMASDAAQFTLLSADRDSARDLMRRMATHADDKEILRAQDAWRQWEATVGIARSGLLDAATQQAEAKLVAVAKARLVPFGGVCPSRYFPSVLMQKVLAGRAF